MEEQNPLKIRLIKNKRELNAVLRIRKIVFIKGQHVPKSRERDGLDSTSKHVIVFYNSKPTGCARIRFLGKKAKLERIAILSSYQGKGFGRKLMDYLIQYCKRKGAKEIVVHSQIYVKDFYLVCGFKPRGKIFLDAGIKHVTMGLRSPESS